MISTTVKHEPAAECSGTHCHMHRVDEPTNDNTYRMCLECGHVYQTAGALRRAYRREIWGHWWQPGPLGKGAPLTWTLWRMATIRAKNITFCQECIHDF